MINIDKLAKIASKELKTGEEFKASAAGRIVSHDAGDEFVDCFIGATEHRIIVLIKSLFCVKQLTDFAFTQATEFSFKENENRFYFTAANEHFVLGDVLRIPNPKELSGFIKGKKTPDKVTFEATSLTVPAKK
ncbi:MAG: hypothetical protein ACREOO_32610 [bacterium]